MIAFRDRRMAELGLDLIVHTNPDGLAAGVGPFTHGSACHTEVMKTDALKQALDLHVFDVAFGAPGAMKKSYAPRNGFSPSERAIIAGIRRTSALNCGRSTYLAAERPVVERDGTLIMVDDDRMPLFKGEVPRMEMVRFRTLGCYPLTGAIRSQATKLPAIVAEMLQSSTSDHQGRIIDSDSGASMEDNKQAGYF